MMQLAASKSGVRVPLAAISAAVQKRTAPLAAIVREAAITDVYAIAARMRPADAGEATAMGRDPRRALRASFRMSLVSPRVLLLEDEPAAIWGLGGPILSDIGHPWLVTTAAIDRVPILVVRTARAELGLMLERKSRLENVVAADYPRAIRLLEVLGFTIDPAEPMGPRGAPFRRFWIERR